MVQSNVQIELSATWHCPCCSRRTYQSGTGLTHLPTPRGCTSEFLRHKETQALIKPSMDHSQTSLMHTFLGVMWKCSTNIGANLNPRQSPVYSWVFPWTLHSGQSLSKPPTTLLSIRDTTPLSPRRNCS